MVGLEKGKKVFMDMSIKRIPNQIKTIHERHEKHEKKLRSFVALESQFHTNLMGNIHKTSSLLPTHFVFFVAFVDKCLLKFKPAK